MDKFKALLIDDEEELVTTLVERLGYRGIEAEYSLDGYDALAKMRTGNYDVVVLDLKLPGLGGLEVLNRLNKDYPNTPVLLITGHGSPENEFETKPEGVFDYLVKPVSLEYLITKMKEALVNK